MSDKTCKTCRWWQVDEDDWHVKSHKCMCPKVVFNEYDKQLADDNAQVVDGSGYYAAFLPGPDFGCIHHASEILPPDEPLPAPKEQV